MPIDVKLKDVDKSKVEIALSKAKNTCLKCEKKKCESCYMNYVIQSLDVFLKEETFNLSINWKVLRSQQQFSNIKLQELLMSLESICLKCGILHIDNCFANFAIQCVQLLLFGKILPRETEEK